jgi:soluble lytic murein transglycosylase
MNFNLSRRAGLCNIVQSPYAGLNLFFYMKRIKKMRFMQVITFMSLFLSALCTNPFSNKTLASDSDHSVFARGQTPEARKNTVQALRFIEENKWSKAKELIAQSKDPLASKIYHWVLLNNTDKGEWNNQLFISLSQFIRHNPEWPNVEKMKKHAEQVMPETLSNDEVVAWYEDFSPQSFKGMRRYMDALIINGKRDQAKEMLADWWASSEISRAQQKQIVRDYKAYLTLEAHKKRCDTLLYKGQYDNALAIADLLGNGYPELARARMALAENKTAGLSRAIDAVPKFLQNDPGLLYERLRWRRKKNLDSGALELLYKTPNADLIQHKEEWWKERHIMIRRLLEKGEYQQAYELASAHIQDEGFAYSQAEWIAGWLALRIINKPTEAYERFTALYAKVTTPVSKSRAAYWAGRAMQDVGNGVLAQDWYKKAAEFKMTFYGQMASVALSQENQLPQRRMPNLSTSQRETYERSELIQASDIFLEAGQTRMSEAFINAFLQKDGTPKAYRFVAEYVAEKGNSHLAVKLAKKAMNKGLFLTKQSYPTITKQLTDVHHTEWALVHALIRQESMFDINAKSSAGALGLMQIMPSTAQHLAKRSGITYNKAWLTANPKYNITLGSYYIAQLINRYDGSYPLAIAAYNAGPGRVDAWLKNFGDPRKGDVDLIDWIELIPIYETRNYVQRVMEGVYIYRLRLKHIQKQPDKQLHVDIYSKNPAKIGLYR